MLVLIGVAWLVVCGSGAGLSARQMKARVRYMSPATSPGFWKQMRIHNAVLTFRLGVDSQGKVTCIDAISGHPILLSPVIESLKNWRFRVTRLSDGTRPQNGSPRYF